MGDWCFPVSLASTISLGPQDPGTVGLRLSLGKCGAADAQGGAGSFASLVGFREDNPEKELGNEELRSVRNKGSEG